MFSRNHHWLPIVLAIYLPICCFITYGIAVSNNHVEPAFPYISDTGTLPPESCIFGQFLNIGAVLAGIVVYHRYRQIYEHIADDAERKCLKHLNTVTFVLGMIMCFGVSVVANFQESNVIIVHLLGAFMAFAIGFIYCVCQTVISYKIDDAVELPGNTLFLKRFRAVLCVVDFCFLVISLSLALHVFYETDVSTTTGKGYSEHVTATVTEWLISFVTVIYIATYYFEFRHFRVSAPKLDYYDSSHCRSNQVGNDQTIQVAHIV